MGELLSKPLYSDHRVGILCAVRQKKGVLDLTRRKGEMRSAKLARNTRDFGIASAIDVHKATRGKTRSRSSRSMSPTDKSVMINQRKCRQTNLNELARELPQLVLGHHSSILVSYLCFKVILHVFKYIFSLTIPSDFPYPPIVP